MTIQPGDWNWLEITKIAVSAATPVALGIAGYYFNHRLKDREQFYWRERSLIERRYKLFDQIAHDMNDLLCFMTFVGDWKEISPLDIIVKKRSLDKIVNVNRHILSNDFLSSYENFAATCFRTNTGWGQTAKINAEIANGWGDRRKHAKYPWEDQFEIMFSDEPADRKSVFQSYDEAMSKYRKLIRLD